MAENEAQKFHTKKKIKTTLFPYKGFLYLKYFNAS